MWIKRDLHRRLYGHNVLDIFKVISNPRSFQHARHRLSEDFPDLAQLDIDSKTDWIKQIALILNLNQHDLEHEIEKQVLRSYLINENYNAIVQYILDEDRTLEDRERYCKNLRRNLFLRHMAMIGTGTFHMIKTSLLVVFWSTLLPNVLALFLGLHPGWWLLLSAFLGLPAVVMLYFNNRNAQGGVVEDVYNKLIGR